MIVDLRIYTIKPGKMAEFLKLYEDYGWPLQQKYLGKCLGWYTTVEGALNTVVHLWGYEDQGDREKRRAAMAVDPGWIDYLKRSAELAAVTAQENRFLKATPFGPQH
jgi:hypothetical protein